MRDDDLEQGETIYVDRSGNNQTTTTVRHYRSGSSTTSTVTSEVFVQQRPDTHLQQTQVVVRERSEGDVYVNMCGGCCCCLYYLCLVLLLVYLIIRK